MVRLGLIGLGRWGKVYVRTLLSLGDRCRVVGLGTRNPANADLVPYPVEVTADWRQVISSACDAVIIATPAHTHAALVAACVEAGKPCLVEKPLCVDVATAARLHQHIGLTQVPVFVNHTQLFHPAYQAMKRAVAASAEAIRVIVSEGMSLGPFRAHTAALWDWGPHDVSLCLDLSGEAPIHVAALGGPSDSGGHPELVSIRLDFRGGACAWIQAGRLSSQQRRRLSVFTDERLYVVDDLARDPLTVLPFRFARREADDPWELSPPRAMSVPSEHPTMVHALTYFLDGLMGGDRRYFGTQLALEVTQVLAQCEALLRSEARDGDAGVAFSRS